jgi:hypothetical protein
VKILELGAFLHGQTLQNQPARRKAIPSDKTVCPNAATPFFNHLRAPIY